MFTVVYAPGYNYNHADIYFCTGTLNGRFEPENKANWLYIDMAEAGCYKDYNINPNLSGVTDKDVEDMIFRIKARTGIEVVNTRVRAVLEKAQRKGLAAREYVPPLEKMKSKFPWGKTTRTMINDDWNGEVINKPGQTYLVRVYHQETDWNTDIDGYLGIIATTGWTTTLRYCN